MEVVVGNWEIEEWTISQRVKFGCKGIKIFLRIGSPVTKVLSPLGWGDALRTRKEFSFKVRWFETDY